ncbi:hypothetical protein HL653_03105 [Sphingomonas sp. AP4-R1]|uniref:hypothetical protein n=1 Tax=Sphingomonas sp. AP4-R1 TaxID=2735134 RepID=UPI0014934465|nr:hypothetical protein [Sphingomonas sp. AP4-R1]QJU56915.1 hypothetical protein HL653_03105 [Sphingomonas sp. AP4-R1]
MKKVVAGALIGAATAYTLIIAFMVVFTVGFFGARSLRGDGIGLVVFFLIAVSPVAVWLYCLKHAKAWLRGGQPPF